MLNTIHLKFNVPYFQRRHPFIHHSLDLISLRIWFPKDDHIRVFSRVLKGMLESNAGIKRAFTVAEKNWNGNGKWHGGMRSVVFSRSLTARSGEFTGWDVPCTAWTIL